MTYTLILSLTAILLAVVSMLISCLSIRESRLQTAQLGRMAAEMAQRKAEQDEIEAQQTRIAEALLEKQKNYFSVGGQVPQPEPAKRKLDLAHGDSQPDRPRRSGLPKTRASHQADPSLKGAFTDQLRTAHKTPIKLDILKDVEPSYEDYTLITPLDEPVPDEHPSYFGSLMDSAIPLDPPRLEVSDAPPAAGGWSGFSLDAPAATPEPSPAPSPSPSSDYSSSSSDSSSSSSSDSSSSSSWSD